MKLCDAHSRFHEDDGGGCIECIIDDMGKEREQLREALELCLRSMETGLVDYNPFDEAAMGLARAALAAADGEEV